MYAHGGNDGELVSPCSLKTMSDVVWTCRAAVFEMYERRRFDKGPSATLLGHAMAVPRGLMMLSPSVWLDTNNRSPFNDFK